MAFKKGDVAWNKGIKGSTVKKHEISYYYSHRDEFIARATRQKRERKELKAGRVKPDKCEICGNGGKIVFDHDHATGKFRGWICHSCNVALGAAKDNPAILQAQMRYLLKHYVESALERGPLVLPK